MFKSRFLMCCRLVFGAKLFTRLAAGLIGGVNGAKGSASGLNNEGSCFMTVFPTSNLASRKFRSNLSSDFISSRLRHFSLLRS